MMNAFEDNTRFDFPVIETDRLSLEMFEDGDLDSMFRLFNDEAVQRHLSPRNRRTREQMKVTLRFFMQRWKERGFGLWRINEKHADEMLGYCGFQYFDKSKNIEILFAYFEKSWGRGFATEAANACLRYWFENLSTAKLFAAAHYENAASRRVLEKIGMIFEERNFVHEVDVATYSISRRDFKAEESFYKLTRRQV